MPSKVCKWPVLFHVYDFKKEPFGCYTSGAGVSGADLAMPNFGWMVASVSACLHPNNQMARLHRFRDGTGRSAGICDRSLPRSTSPPPNPPPRPPSVMPWNCSPPRRRNRTFPLIGSLSSFRRCLLTVTLVLRSAGKGGEGGRREGKPARNTLALLLDAN